MPQLVGCKLCAGLSDTARVYCFYSTEVRLERLTSSVIAMSKFVPSGDLEKPAHHYFYFMLFEKASGRKSAGSIDIVCCHIFWEYLCFYRKSKLNYNLKQLLLPKATCWALLFLSLMRLACSSADLLRLKLRFLATSSSPSCNKIFWKQWAMYSCK